MLQRRPPRPDALPTEVALRGRPSTDSVFREHAPFVLRILRSLGVHPDDVEDVLQDVFMTIHRMLPTYEERQAMRPWLYSLCARAAARSRQRRRRTVVVEFEEAHLTTRSTPEDALRADESRAELELLLGTLTTDCRTVFVLYEIEEFTMEEIAATVGCPVATGYSRLRAARKTVLGGAKRLAARRGSW